jgi:hypothetical protein
MLLHHMFVIKPRAADLGCLSVELRSIVVDLFLEWLWLLKSMSHFVFQDTFFYSLVYDAQQKSLIADHGDIRVGSRYQAEQIPDLLSSGLYPESCSCKAVFTVVLFVSGGGIFIWRQLLVRLAVVWPGCCHSIDGYESLNVSPVLASAATKIIVIDRDINRKQLWEMWWMTCCMGSK